MVGTISPIWDPGLLSPVEPATSITKTHYFPALTGNRSREILSWLHSKEQHGGWHHQPECNGEAMRTTVQDFGSGEGSGSETPLSDWCPQSHCYSSHLSWTSCQCSSELDPIGWLWCLVWNRAGCSAKVSPQVIACRNWSWCWCRDRSRRIQI